MVIKKRNIKNMPTNQLKLNFLPNSNFMEKDLKKLNKTPAKLGKLSNHFHLIKCA